MSNLKKMLLKNHDHKNILSKKIIISIVSFRHDEKICTPGFNES